MHTTADALSWLQALQNLPDNLAVLTVSAALSTSPPCVATHRSTHGARNAARSIRSQRGILNLLTQLPTPLHPLVLRAHDAAVDRAASLTLPIPDLRTAPAVMHVAATGLRLQLTSLVLRDIPLCWSSAAHSMRTRGIPEATAHKALDAVTATAAMMPLLEELRLEFADVRPNRGRRGGAVGQLVATGESAFGAVWRWLRPGAAGHPPPDDLARVFDRLATLTRLDSFTLQVPDACAAPGRARALAQAASSALPSMPLLTHLRLQMSLHDSETVCALSRRLPALAALCSLDLGGCGLSMGPSQTNARALRVLVAALRALRELTHLSLARNPLGARGWDMIAPVAAALPLQSLDLERCRFYDPFALCRRAEPSESPRLSTLQRLRLSHNRARHPGLHLAQQASRLTHLALAHLPLTAAAEDRLLAMLLEHPAPRLRVFEFGRCHASEAATAALGRCLEQWRSLQLLSLSWHVAAAAAPLAQLMPHLATLTCLQVLRLDSVILTVADVPVSFTRCVALTRLVLQEVACGRDAADAFAPRLNALTNLRSLELTADEVRFESGCGATMARGVSSLACLTHLKLRCALGDVGAHHLACGLACMEGMHALYLADNGICAVGTLALAGALPALRVLSMLELSGNRVGDQGAAALSGVLPWMSALRVLRLAECGVSAAAGARMVRVAPPGTEEVTVS